MIKVYLDLMWPVEVRLDYLTLRCRINGFVDFETIHEFKRYLDRTEETFFPLYEKEDIGSKKRFVNRVFLMTFMEFSEDEESNWKAEKKLGKVS